MSMAAMMQMGMMGSGMMGPWYRNDGSWYDATRHDERTWNDDGSLKIIS